MITDFLFKSFIAILRFIATPIMGWPDAAFDPTYATSLATAVADFKQLAYAFPFVFYAIMLGLIALVGFEFLLGGYKIIMWGIKKIPFIN